MKALILTLLTLATSPAQAATVCGLIGHHIVAPHCVPRRPCPQWRRLQYDITLDSGSKFDLDAPTTEVLQGFQTYNGKQACVDGSPQRDRSIQVNSITAR
jgi:hypothetical protein